jgi:uncharacterized OB-fold protein
VADVVRDADSEEFFDGAARGDLMIKRCEACGHSLRPDAIACSKCHASSLSWVRASGRGAIVSWIVVHGNEHDPSVVGLVELDEGPWLHARLLDVDRERLSVGDPVSVDFEPAGAEHVPVFRGAVR